MYHKPDEILWFVIIINHLVFSCFITTRKEIKKDEPVSNNTNENKVVATGLMTAGAAMAGSAIVGIKTRKKLSRCEKKNEIIELRFQESE